MRLSLTLCAVTLCTPIAFNVLAQQVPPPTPEQRAANAELDAQTNDVLLTEARAQHKADLAKAIGISNTAQAAQAQVTDLRKQVEALTKAVSDNKSLLDEKDAQIAGLTKERDALKEQLAESAKPLATPTLPPSMTPMPPEAKP
jgi:septal ring factor EnvC (AmiA/AmiB activator)